MYIDFLSISPCTTIYLNVSTLKMDKSNVTNPSYDIFIVNEDAFFILKRKTYDLHTSRIND